MSSVSQWRERGVALAPRAARRSRRSLKQRVQRLRQRSFFIVQCALAAATAWGVARYALGHPTPFFAPVAAMITLGMSFGQRLRRAVEIMVGVAVGVFVGDLFVQVFGSGIWQIALVVVAAMSIAVLLGAGALMVTQAGVQSVIVITLLAQPSTALNRWVDALVGGLIALAAATVVPAAPLRKPRVQASLVVRELSGILADTASALQRGDTDLARATLSRARQSERALDELRTLSAEGIEVVRLSPFRRGHLPGVQAIADIVEPLDRAVRNVRVLVRRAAHSVRTKETVPPSYVGLVADLAQVTGDIAAGLQEHRMLPDNTRDALAAVGAASALPALHPTLSAEVMRAQVRSMVVDLLMLTGLTYDEALSRVPPSADALDDDGLDDDGLDETR